MQKVNQVCSIYFTANLGWILTSLQTSLQFCFGFIVQELYWNSWHGELKYEKARLIINLQSVFRKLSWNVNHGNAGKNYFFHYYSQIEMVSLEIEQQLLKARGSFSRMVLCPSSLIKSLLVRHRKRGMKKWGGGEGDINFMNNYNPFVCIQHVYTVV